MDKKHECTCKDHPCESCTCDDINKIKITGTLDGQLGMKITEDHQE